MTGPLLRVLPLGPFPPRGPATDGDTLDLGATLRDHLLCRGAVEGLYRRGLQARLAAALEAGRFEEGAELLALWLDTWPMAASVDPARAEWAAAPSAAALATLGHAARMASRTLSWPCIPGTDWPLPPAGWVREQVGERPLRLVGRGPHDQRGVVEAALGQRVEEEVPDGLPPVLEVDGAALAGRRAAVVRSLVQGEAVAVRLAGLVPPDPASQLALGEVRMEGRCQDAVERYGPAGAWASGEARWVDQLQAAPPGEPGPVLAAVGEALLAPGTPESVRRGQLSTTGWLVWTAPFRPVAVRPVAVEVLRALDGERDLAAVARAVGGPEDGVRAVADALVELGAATAV